MSLTLFMHPLSSYCWKALTALYENDTPFTPISIDLGDERERKSLTDLWPIGKFPVLRDDARNVTLPESTILIEYLDQHYLGPTRFIPADPDLALQTRLRDRFYDLHLHNHMQKVIGDRIRPADQRDPAGVKEARGKMALALDMIEAQMETSTWARNTWAMGETFTLADCAAAPALYYANKVIPYAKTHTNVMRYLERLLSQPSFARAVEQAQPFVHMFPSE